MPVLQVHKQLALLAAMQQLELLLAANAWQVLMPKAQETALATLAKKVLIKETLGKHLALLAKKVLMLQLRD